jgi:hypothetical protein
VSEGQYQSEEGIEGEEGRRIDDNKLKRLKGKMKWKLGEGEFRSCAGEKWTIGSCLLC